MRLTKKDKIKELMNLKKHNVLMTDNDYKELKLGQLEDIEEELGIDLITLFKVLKNGIYVKIGREIDYIQYVSIYKKRKWHLYSSDTFWGKYDICLVQDYGKTWSLDKKDLTKEN